MLLDIGCHEGELLTKVSGKISKGVGIDAVCVNENLLPNIQLIKGVFPGGLACHCKFNCITGLAVFEHIPDKEKYSFIRACFDLLDDGGKLIFTIPSQQVDSILPVLKKMKLIDGMNLEQHHGYEPGGVVKLAERVGFHLLIHEKFQLGLNHLFVFSRR